MSAIARQPVVSPWFPPPLCRDIQDRRHRTESVRFQHPGPPGPRLTLILAYSQFTTHCRQPVADPLDRLAEAPVEVADGIVQAFLDLVFDVALDAVGVVRGELRHEMVRIRHRRDAVADAELSLQRFLRGIVLDAEQLAEVEPGLVDVVLVVLDEAGALAHHALPEAVQQLHVVLVVGDGEEAASLVVPGQRLLVMRAPRPAHDRGERRKCGLGQQALVVAPGAGGGLVVDGDMVARLAVVEPARPGADAQGLARERRRLQLPGTPALPGSRELALLLGALDQGLALRRGPGDRAVEHGAGGRRA